MNLSFIDHYSRAIQLRASLHLEAKRSGKKGNILPKGIAKWIWKEPQFNEEYIWLLRFVSNTEQVTLIDIGGNSGYWTEAFLKYYPNAIVYAFEPVKDMYEQYKSRFKDHKNITLHNTALGVEKEEREINVAKGYGLTSFNTYDKNLEEKNVHFMRTEKVSIDKLDNFHSEIIYNKTIIKVDVQGFETFVIEGGLQVFKNADVAIIECSFANEFKDQLPTFGEVTMLLRKVGMHPVEFGVYDHAISRIAFERNVLFVNEKHFDKIFGR